MILSNESIQQALDRGWLRISPEPSPRRRSAGERCPYQTSSVDLRLGTEVSYFREHLPVAIDLRRGDFNALFGMNSESITLTDAQPFHLAPRKLVLARTLERVELPLPSDDASPCFAARVKGKSSYARCGLLVHFTAPTIHAGFEGTITLELINLGEIPILLAPGMPICQLIIEKVDGVPFRNDSRFQGQARAGGGRT